MTAPAPAPAPPGRADVQAIYPLSPLQKGMLFHSLYAPGTAMYVQQLSCLLAGDLDPAAFEAAWQLAVDRHPVLRTAFVWEGLEEPLQVVQRHLPLPVARLDWSGLPAAEQAERLAAHLEDDRRRGFDLARAPLTRVALIRLGPGRHRFVWTTHHLVLDGWSGALLLREVLAAYEARCAGAAPDLPPARPFRDYILWLKAHAGADPAPFWRATLRGFAAPTPLAGARPERGPADRRRPQGEEHDARELRLPAAETAALQAFARRHQLTRSTLVSGAWAVLLARYGGGEDVLFGTVVSGRPPGLPGVEEMVGLFINSLPLRAAARGGARLSPWLAGLQEAAVRLQERAHDPLPGIQQASELPPGVALFETLVVFESYPLDAALRERSGSLAVSEVRSLEHSNYPLTLVVSPLSAASGAELSLRAAYDRERLDGPAAGRLLAHLATLLGEMTADPGRAELRLDELPLLTAAERAEIAAARAAAVVEDRTDGRPEAGAADLPLHLRFARQAAATPDAVAVTEEGRVSTYGGLAARAGRLARHLRGLGTAPGEVVGLYLDRSAALVEGMLGVLAAGGAYLPLDPVQPEERLAFVLDDAGVRLLLTGGGLGERLTERSIGCLGAGRTVLDLGRLDDGTVASGPAELATVPDPGLDGLAYVIYTSGSTGRPKGALLTHRNAARLFRATASWFGFGPADVWTLFHSPAFDFSVWEIWGALLHGGRLAVVPYWVSRAPDRFLALLEDEQVTVLNQTPSAFGQLLRAEQEAAAAGRGATRLALRLVIFGGEALDPRAVAPWLAGEGRPRLVNMYGITETTVHVTYRPLTPADAAAAGSPIGEPIPDLTLAVADVHGQPAPLGAVGELLVGGPGLAVGYLGRPELTAERFVPDPAASLPGARLYRSGDLVRRGENGGLDYLGRADRQVKVRGFRIEPGEIEAALLAQSGVGAAAVVVREEAAGGVLVAYVVPTTGGMPPGLRAALERRLPAYMVPVLIAVDELPLTANGKVDRAVLARREPPAGATSEGMYVPPRTPLEELLAGIWADVLRQPRVGAEAHFFALGGSSMLSLQVVSRCRRAGLAVSPRDLFEAPVLADLAARLAAAGRPAPPPIEPLPRGVPRPLSFAQERLWFLDRLEPGNGAYNIPAAFRLSGRFDAAALEAALTEVARRHDALRTTFRAESQDPVQVVGEPGPVAVPRIDLAGLPGDLRPGSLREAELQRLAAAEARGPFDLERGPLWRAALVALGENEAALLVTLHHIIGDGWSVGVLVREVAALYRAVLAGAAPPLAELPIQYTDFAVWQRRLLGDESGEGPELAYWRRQLAGIPVLALPTDRPRPPRQTFAGALQPVRLGAARSRALAQLARRQAATPFMVLLAGFAALLRRLSGQDDFGVGTFTANRTRPEVEGLIGFFVNNLVLRPRLPGDPPFGELLARCRETALDAFAAQDLPFEAVLAELRPERNLAHPPLFQVMLVLQNMPQEEPALADVALSRLPPPGGRANFDLTLWLREERPEHPETAELAGYLEYNRDLFEAATLERWAGHLAVLLDGALAGPGLRLSDLPLLAAGERWQVLGEWSPGPAAEPVRRTVLERFAERAAAAPDAVAIAAGAGNHHLTYAGLARAASRIAGRLAAAGVGPETAVGVALERSPEMLAAVLGVLAAGGFYVPLDLASPPARRAAILADAGAPVLLTERRYALPETALPETGGPRSWRQWLLDEPAAEEGAEAPVQATPLPAGSGLDHLAYAVYTSGSTGRPKGVLVGHRPLAHHTRDAAACFGLAPGDRVLQLAALSFDASAEEIWPCLTSGATLVLRDPGPLAAPRELLARCGELGVTVLDLPTAYWHEATLALEQGTAALPAGLRLTILGGERALPERFAAWRRAAPAVRLLNTYGPTEATVVATRAELGAGTSETSELPIGRPISGVRAYVLDRALQPLPAGVPGELCLGGAGLARGYLHRPDLTAERFVADPCGTEPGARLYRTGDLARWRPDGRLEFAGRLDQQVKVRGFRVEPGEVEAALAAHPDVAAAAVTARDDLPGGRGLAAYLAPRSGTALDAGAVRAFLAERLPDHMIPAAWVVLPELPLGAGGKVDRRALPAPERGGPEREGYVAPRSPIESLLAGIWSDLLQVERVGVYDSFFQLGGHSLLATRLVSRIQLALEVDLPLRSLFEAPTLAEMALAVEELVIARLEGMSEEELARLE